MNAADVQGVVARESAELAVIGAGPAGMAAAALATEFGLRTVLLDEQEAPGGQIYRSIEAAQAQGGSRLAALGADYAAGGALAQRLWASGAAYRPLASVWSIEPGPVLGVSDQRGEGAVSLLSAQRVLIATGAQERPVPIPGWTTPGVMSAGAMQALLKTSGALPAAPTVLVGCGPLLFLVAVQLLDLGVPPRALLLTTSKPQSLQALKFPTALWAARADLVKGLRWMSRLRAAGVPMFWGVRAPAIEAGADAQGNSCVRAVRFEHAGRAQRIECALALLHEGVVAGTQLSMLAGCEHRWDEAQRCWHPVLDAMGRSTVAGISIAGDAAGIQGATAAVHRGRIAAIDAAQALGKLDAGRAATLLRTEQRTLTPLVRARVLLDRLMPPSREMIDAMADDTLVCRCEEVTAGAIRTALAQGCTGPNQLKAFTRCGMGPCQGRMCALTVTELLASIQDISPLVVGHARVRPPLKPIPLQALAALAPPVK